MIKDVEVLRRFEQEETQKKKLSYQEALKIFEALWREALALGVLPPKDPFEGIEVDIRIARFLN